MSDAKAETEFDEQSQRTENVPDTEANAISVDNSIDEESKSAPELKSSLPCLKLHIPLSISCAHLLNLFHAVANQQSFQVIEAEENVATAVSKDLFSFKKIFSKCFPTRKEEDDSMCAIKLQISVNEAKGCRRVVLKGLSGDYSRLQQF